MNKTTRKVNEKHRKRRTRIKNKRREQVKAKPARK